MPRFLLALLVTCFAAPVSYAEPLKVEPCKLGTYWQAKMGKIAIAPALMADPGKGWALVSFEINGQGKVINATIAKSSKNQKFDARALAIAASVRYEPSDTNAAKAPVTSQMFSNTRGLAGAEQHRPKCSG